MTTYTHTPFSGLNFSSLDRYIYYFNLLVDNAVDELSGRSEEIGVLFTFSFGEFIFTGGGLVGIQNFDDTPSVWRQGNFVVVEWGDDKPEE